MSYYIYGDNVIKRMNGFIKDKRGAINPLIIIATFLLMVVFYIYLQIYIPFYTGSLEPLLANVAYGSLIAVLFEMSPVVIAILIFSYSIMKSGLVSERPPY